MSRTDRQIGKVHHIGAVGRVGVPGPLQVAQAAALAVIAPTLRGRAKGFTHPIADQQTRPAGAAMDEAGLHGLREVVLGGHVRDRIQECLQRPVTSRKEGLLDKGPLRPHRPQGPRAGATTRRTRGTAGDSHRPSSMDPLGTCVERSCASRGCSVWRPSAARRMGVNNILTRFVRLLISHALQDLEWNDRFGE
jgi:hypothetical protein